MQRILVLGGGQQGRVIATDLAGDCAVTVADVRDDPVVPNASTEALARTMKLPLVEPFLVDVTGLAHEPAPVLGSGLTQFDLGALGFLRHGLLLLTQKAGTQIGHFFETQQGRGTGEIIRP